MKKIAFFDFCDTLVGFQTADAFVDYVSNAENSYYMSFLGNISNLLNKIRIIGILHKFFSGAAIGKKLKLLQLRGLKFEKVDELAESFYRERIIPGLITSIIYEMNRLNAEGYEICIVSAGYSVYLKYFANDHGIKHVISTEIAFGKKGDRCLGKIKGKDCISFEKVNMINEYFRGQDINFGESVSFSDSVTDLPMLLLSGKGVVVSRNSSQPWSTKYNFKEILWDKK